MRLASITHRSLRLTKAKTPTRPSSALQLSLLPIVPSRYFVASRTSRRSRQSHVSSLGRVQDTDGHYSPLLDPLPISDSSPSTRERLVSGEDAENETIAFPPLAWRKSPEAWIDILDQYLPRDLRSSSTHSRLSHALHGPEWKNIVDLVRHGRRRAHADVNLIVYMVMQQRRYQAALYLIELLLRHAASHTSKLDKRDPPSNIVWPSDRSLDKATSRPLEVEPPALKATPRLEQTLSRLFDSSRDHVFQQQKDETMSFTWQTLGDLIVDVADLPKGQSSEVLGLVHQVLAQMHNLGLVSSEVYKFTPMSGSVAVQRPPIIHLVSSRILTTMSDAVWRSRQDEAIARAASSGMRLEEIGKDPPGGRFRLVVRQLGPEIWLEFVLWCCIEGGFVHAARHIIQALRAKSNNPWFAVDWTNGDGAVHESPAIDWDRVKNRTGGTVGWIDGYSMESPLVEMPRRTISSEVVLAVIEALINSVELGADKGLSHAYVHGAVRDMVDFLEPHGMSSAYFDYLTVRLLESGIISTAPEPRNLLSWHNTIEDIRKLETIAKPAPLAPSFRYESILAHSELRAGIMHQCLDAFIQAGYTQRSLTVFGRIQELVDNSRLEAIQSFLSMSPVSGFFSSRPYDTKLDWVQSHGQLPVFKLASFLDLITESSLHGLGRWLLHSGDVDGEVIPRSSYGLSCMASAVIRYAARSNDPDLARVVLEHRMGANALKPSVNLLRTYINACITFLDFDAARLLLTRVQQAEGGGFGPSNVAVLGATIIRLEHEYDQYQNPEQGTMLQDAHDLMTDILDGKFDMTRDTFTLRQKVIFRQQTGYLLRLFENIENATLASYSKKFGYRFPESNLPGLAPSSFNIVLEAIVDTLGSSYGRKIWTIFCRDPRHDANQSSNILLDDVIKEDNKEDDDDLTQDQIPLEFSTDGQSIKAPPPEDVGTKPTGGEGISLDPDTLSSFTDFIQFDLKSPPTSDRSASPPTSRPRPSEHIAALPATPLVIPTIHTLRIIVRAALAQRRNPTEGFFGKAHNEEQAKRVLRWAQGYFDAFGVSKVAMDDEFRNESLVDTEISVPPTRRRVREKKPVNPGVRFNQGKFVASPPGYRNKRLGGLVQAASRRRQSQ